MIRATKAAWVAAVLAVLTALTWYLDAELEVPIGPLVELTGVLASFALVAVPLFWWEDRKGQD